jgi:iron complex outermembrane receptor protein
MSKNRARSRLVPLAVTGIVLASPVLAEEAEAVAPVTVIAASPLPGTGVDIDKAPTAVDTLSAGDIARGGSPSATGALADQLAGVNLADNLGDPFQPDVIIRGFTASPVLGTPQGVAVYLNGARINEAFGETVNWDLIADLAIRRLDVLGADPAFGLNAIGGALAITMKTGFSDPGGDAAVSGGSFGRREGSAEYGAHGERFGLYLAARALDEDGWRAFSANRLRQTYGDASVRAGPLTLDLAVNLADNRLRGESATPVQELAVDRASVFTTPQENDDRLVFVTVDGGYDLGSALSLQAGAYYRGFRQDVVNGDASDYTPCAEGPDQGLLCQPGALTPLAGPTGQPIPYISAGGALPIGQNDREHIRSDGFGLSLQATSTARLWRRGNHLTVGASLDQAVTDFSSSAEVGPIDAALRVTPTGLFVATPEGTPFAATPVDLHATSSYLGLYVADTFDLTSRLSVTASGRYNEARIHLDDRLGEALNGRNRYRRFNPALGAAWRVGAGVTLYGGYSEGVRAPNASEIECSNPLVPCLLPSSLASDPPSLRQVVSRAWEAGARGRLALAGGTLSWNAGWFRTGVSDDIVAVSTSLSAGYFQNIGGTRRQGVELGARYRRPRFSAFADYSYVEATFRSAFDEPSPSHPLADAAGQIEVRPGDRLPGVPRHRLKLGAEVEPRRGWTVGVTVAVIGDEVYRGDESNQLAPLPGHTVVNLHSSVDATRRLTLFASIENAVDARYATFGVLGDPTGIGAPGVPEGPAADPRFQTPAGPIAAYGGVRLRF